MQLTSRLQQHLAQAVRTSMRIEGNRAAVLPQTQALMEQQRVQVSAPAKRHLQQLIDRNLTQSDSTA